MDFTEYKNNVEKILAKNNKNIKYNIDNMFEAYINDIDPKICAKALVNTISESFFQDKYDEYKKEVLRVLRKNGFDIRKPHKDLETLINDYYANEAEPLECATECLKEIKKNTVKIDNKKLGIIASKNIIKNKLLLLIHNIDNCGLVDLIVKNNDIYMSLNIKLFTLRNEINTNVKSYIGELDKQFKAYLNQNIDRKDRVVINGYYMSNNTVYVNTLMKLDCISNDGFRDIKFSKKETISMLNMYIEIFRMFAEQYNSFT